MRTVALIVLVTAVIVSLLAAASIGVGFPASSGTSRATGNASQPQAPMRISSLEELERILSAPAEMATEYLAGERFSATITAAPLPAPELGKTAYTATNVQVEGVDEADIVKTDGRLIYYATTTPPYRVLVIDPGSLEIIREIPLETPAVGLYLYKDKLVILSRSRIVKAGVLPWIAGETRISVYRLGDYKLVFSSSVSGWYLSSRLLNGTVYLVSTQPAAVRVKPILPRVGGREVKPNNILYLGGPARTYTLVYALSLESLTDNVEVLLSGPSTRIYVSRDSLYLVQQIYDGYRLALKNAIDVYIAALPPDLRSLAAQVANSSLSDSARTSIIQRIFSDYASRLGYDEKRKLAASMEEKLSGKLVGLAADKTLVYRFSLRGLNATLEARATVPGRVLDQFAMDEYNDTFRIATTSSKIVKIRVSPENPAYFWPVTETSTGLYVFSKKSLELLGSVEGLAPGERMYAARYLGGKAFLVTFRRVDPLFAVDLSDPGKPRVIGRVKIPGYSEYLHPYGRLLVGVGYDADERGRILGLKISLFNVSSLERVEELDSIRLPGSWSEVFRDYHAYTTLDDWFAIPVRGGKLTGFLVVKVDGERGRLVKLCEKNVDGARRAVYINGTLYMLSDRSALAVNLSTCETLGEKSFSPLAAQHGRARIAYYSVRGGLLTVAVEIQLPNPCYKLLPGEAVIEGRTIKLRGSVEEPRKGQVCVQVVKPAVAKWQAKAPESGEYKVLVELVYKPSGKKEELYAGVIRV